jgi:hypothetical protein
MLEFVGSFGLFITGLAKPDLWPPLWYTSLIFFVLYPFLNELFLSLKGCLFSSGVQKLPHYLQKD